MAGHDVPAGFEWFDGEHPLPGFSSECAGRRALDLAHRAARDDVALVVLLSGGASATLAAPAPGLTLADKVATTRTLLRAGVAIDRLNAVRKHLSAVKGGRLAAIAGGALTLAISDVHGPLADDPATIGSGPTVADPTTFAEAIDVIERAGVEESVPAAVMSHLRRGGEETPKPGDARLAQSQFHVIGNRHTSMSGGLSAAASRGYVTHAIEAATSGEARVAGDSFARVAVAFAETCPRPCCILGSGETTVRVRGEGRGGRNQEFALGAAPVLEDWSRAHLRQVVLASAGTDGIDGPTDAAGAFADDSTLTRARAASLDPARALLANATYDFFCALGDLIVWGPTGTNVGDVHAAVIS